MDLRSALGGLLRRTCLLLILIAVISLIVGWFTWTLVDQVQSEVAPVVRSTSHLQQHLARIETLAGRLMLDGTSGRPAVENELTQNVEQATAAIVDLRQHGAGDHQERINDLTANLDHLRQALREADQAEAVAVTAGERVSGAVTNTVTRVDALTTAINDLRTGLQAKLRQAEGLYRRSNQVSLKLTTVASDFRQARWSAIQGLNGVLPATDAVNQLSTACDAVSKIAEDATVSNSTRLRDLALTSKEALSKALAAGPADGKAAAQASLDQLTGIDGEIAQWIDDLQAEANR